MNKKNIVLIVGAVVLLLVGFIGFGKTEKDTATTNGGEIGLNEVSYDDYEALLTGTETNIIYIGSANCGYCTKYKPVITSVAEANNLKVNYLDISKLSTSETTKLNSSNSYLSNNEWGTPTTLILLGNEVVDSLSGYVDEDTLTGFLTDNGLIG